MIGVGLCRLWLPFIAQLGLLQGLGLLLTFISQRLLGATCIGATGFKLIFTGPKICHTFPFQLKTALFFLSAFLNALLSSFLLSFPAFKAFFPDTF